MYYDYSPFDGDRLRFIASPSEAADAWVAGAGNATTKWSTNLQNTTKPIVSRAVAQAQVAKTNYNQAIDSGRWANALNAVGDAGIKAAARAKEANFGTGVSQSRSKYQDFATKFFPQLATIVNNIDNMPSGTIAASKARVNSYIDQTHALKGTLK